jgi:precorrin-2 dehydrogenase / sirohydrochlorin ferrochelatase
MVYYPLFLELSEKPVLVAGAGNVALRKVRGLLEAGARVTVVAPEGHPEMESLPVRRLRRRVRKADLAGCVLVFAATDDRRVNRNLALEARRLGIPVNVADSPEECDFIVPARIRHGGLQVAVSTGGRSPKLAVKLRKRIEQVLREEDADSLKRDRDG